MEDRAPSSTVECNRPSANPDVSSPLLPHSPTPPLRPTITGLHIHRANNITLFSICALWLTLAYLVAVGEVISAERWGPRPLPENKAKIMFLAAHNEKEGSGNAEMLGKL